MKINNDDLLLNTSRSKELYHQVAVHLPVIDYHNHLDPQAMLSDKRFDNITQLWIRDDQYKHRLMRINGVPERYISGDAPDQEKFLKWMETFPKTIGNPLYHWSQLEIRDIFGPGIDLLRQDPGEIWDNCNAKLGNQGFGTMDILRKWKAEMLCTSDDLLDDLAPHKLVSDRETALDVFPSLRSDSILAFEAPGFLNWLKQLEQKCNLNITSLDGYRQAVRQRLSDFEAAGCRLSDHALDTGFCFHLPAAGQAELYFNKVLAGQVLNEQEMTGLKSEVLKFLGLEYGQRKLTMQLHIGAQRVTSSRLKGIAGKFGGFAALGNPLDIGSLCRFLDVLETEGRLPNTILYTLNPADNERIATLTGSFAEDGVAGKIQFGPAWWFNDHYDGIKRQLTALSSFGLLGTSIGMTSDSRSFLSLSRHYYFRRILCHLIGSWVEKGLLPDDYSILSELVSNICYHNAKNFLTKGKI